MDTLIARLKERIRWAPAIECDAYCVYTNDAGEVLPPRRPNPPLSISEVELVEAQLGFKLPTLVRRLCTEIADGGYGPAWGINRVKHPPNLPFGPEWEIEMSVESWHRLYQTENVRARQPAYPERFIRFCEVGCNISICVDCTLDSGALFTDDPNDSQNPLQRMDETVEQWLWRWLIEKPWPTTIYS